jgi:hypothetical protein
MIICWQGDFNLKRMERTTRKNECVIEYLDNLGVIVLLLRYITADGNDLIKRKGGI